MALLKSPTAPLKAALANPTLRREVRRQGGVFAIRSTAPTSAQPAQPETAMAAAWKLRVDEAIVFRFGWSEDVQRFRSALWYSARGSNLKFITRAHKNLLVILRIE